MKQFAGPAPELTQRATRKLTPTKEKILDACERRSSKRMKNYEQEQQKRLEKQAHKKVHHDKKQTKDKDMEMNR